MRRCKVQPSPVQTLISRLCHFIQILEGDWLRVPLYKETEVPEYLQLIQGLSAQTVTLTAMNSTFICPYSLWIISMLSSCLLQRIILWNSWVPFPSACKSTWQVLVSILTSFFQKENWSTDKPRNSWRCFTVWLWNMSESRNRDTESCSKAENEAVKFCSSWSYPLLDLPLCPFFIFMASLGTIYWATSWKPERVLEHLLETGFVNHLSFVTQDIPKYF